MCRACLHVCPRVLPCPARVLRVGVMPLSRGAAWILHFQRGFPRLGVIIVLSESLPVKRRESYFGETQGFVSELRSLQ